MIDIDKVMQETEAAFRAACDEVGGDLGDIFKPIARGDDDGR